MCGWCRGAVLATSIRCLFSLIDTGVSHGLNGGALPNAPTSTVPPQRTSIEVTGSLLCPPELELVARVSRPLYLFV